MYLIKPKTHFITSAAKNASGALTSAMYLVSSVKFSHFDYWQIEALVGIINKTSIALTKACERQCLAAQESMAREKSLETQAKHSNNKQ